MSSLTLPISAAHGALVDVILEPDAILRNAATKIAHAVPGPARFKMLLDTGADATTVHESVIASWNLTGGTWVCVQTANGVRHRLCFDFALAILDSQGQSIITVDPLAITTTDSPVLAGPTYRGLVGRDVLNHGELLYSGKLCQFTLTF